VLPLVSARYRQAEFFVSYVPKVSAGVNHGSVLYVFGKIDLK
jgi:hypothetical protein